jgi:hypothetical protein
MRVLWRPFDSAIQVRVFKTEVECLPIRILWRPFGSANQVRVFKKRK